MAGETTEPGVVDSITDGYSNLFNGEDLSNKQAVYTTITTAIIAYLIGR